MTDKNREHALREHLALISTEAYLLLRSTNEQERINRYNMVQEQINSILNIIDDQKQIHYSCTDFLDSLTP